MRTFTITYHHTHNYGAVLQTYALQQVIYSLGHDNIIFEYPERESLYNKLDWKNIKSLLRNCYINCLIFLRYKKISHCDKGFRKFHERMNLSRRYHSMQDLRDDYPEMDDFIVGSDQVWNLNANTEFVPARLLDFGADNMVRFSYAASIEKLNYTELQKEKVKKCLSRFKGISLREESARKYIEEVTGYNCLRSLDPVFLLSKEQWNKIAVDDKARIIKEPYILCYQVQSVPGMQRVVDELKKRTGYKTVAVCCDAIKRIHVDMSVFDASPEEFLGLYKNAAVVVSGSFHGTAMALVYNKPVYALVRHNHGSRIKELLHMVGLDAFLIEDRGDIPDSGVVDYGKINNIIEKEKMRSADYLKMMLDE